VCVCVCVLLLIMSYAITQVDIGFDVDKPDINSFVATLVPTTSTSRVSTSVPPPTPLSPPPATLSSQIALSASPPVPHHAAPPQAAAARSLVDEVLAGAKRVILAGVSSVQRNRDPRCVQARS
jgi:hypothetical protein